MPTVTVMSGRKREDNPPHLPTPRRAALASTGNKSVSPSEKTTGADKTILLHGPGHSFEECNVLKQYSKKYTAQQPHKDNEYRSGGKTKRNKTVWFDISVKEANIMKYDALITKKNKEKKLNRNHKSESTKADPEGVQNTYVIDHLTIDESTHG